MSALIGTWNRRLVLAFIAMVLSIAIMLILTMIYEGQTVFEALTIGEIMKRLVMLPCLLALAVLTLTAVFVPAVARAATPTEATLPMPGGVMARPFAAQVVGIEWLNPLQRRDYPTEWQILWVQGLAKSNRNDDMVRTMPQKFSTLQSIGALAYGHNGIETFDGFYEKYIDALLPLFADRYAMSGKYFYTVQPKDKKLWRELAGIHVEFAIPAGRLDPVAAQSYLRDRMKLYFEIGSKSSPDLWSKDTPPDVHVSPGGPNAGFTSLNNALAYLRANPDKSVWVMNWDAPSFPPKDGQINENMVLLILAGPDMKTERAPLAWIGKAATGNVQDFEAKAGTTRAVESWKATIEAAAHNANVPATKINYVIHDAGKGSDAASSRIGSLGRTLTESLPEFDFQKQTFNTPGLLGEMGAGTALTDVVLAIGRANHLGETVLVAGTTDAEHPVAVVVAPPAQPLPIDPDADWFRARGENNAYLPWWGRRYDTKYNQQGWSW
ncbi:virulence factor [Paraburkholderia bannensis]|uniref:virulence factor n=1 Tax=Paraburkholderia bannensis TaxID=765414 RepID=UPI002ABD83F0|nr:virulence factor [Paraburkholderia bannensis]